jgi:hypothetical protein
MGQGVLRKSALRLSEIGQHCACQGIYINDSESGFQSVNQRYYVYTVKIRYTSNVSPLARLQHLPQQEGASGHLHDHKRHTAEGQHFFKDYDQSNQFRGQMVKRVSPLQG